MIELPELAYPYDALEPVISAATMRLHHDKHHARYVSVTNELLSNARQPAGSLEEVIATAGPGDRKLFNNAAQAWNHGFFWACMSSRHRAPSGPLLNAVEHRFGSLARLRDAFIAEGTAHFGSGWVWLLARAGELQVVSTHDAGTVAARPDTIPLLVCDLWEHAYYLDHQNDRASFQSAWWERLANWSLAEQQYAAAVGEGKVWLYPQPATPVAA
jgi:Fe-Mn family superoxide dismutase